MSTTPPTPARTLSFDAALAGRIRVLDNPVKFCLAAYVVPMVLTAIGATGRMLMGSIVTVSAIAGLIAAVSAIRRIRRRAGKGTSLIDWSSATTHEAAMRDSVRPSAMEVVDETVRWVRDHRGGQVYPYLITCACQRAEQACLCGMRWSAGVISGFGPAHRVIAAGDWLLAAPVGVVCFVMAHERRHATGWLHYSFRARLLASTAGFVLLGALTPPFAALIMAAPGLLLACTAWGWCDEIACDIAAARLHGTYASAWFTKATQIEAEQKRAPRRWWQRLPSLARRALLPHPPLRLRAWICHQIPERHPTAYEHIR